LENFPSALAYERKIVRSLVKKPQDYRSAMLSLPKSLLHLILSSYQSYIFNKAISLRKKQGFSLSYPINGDIVSILIEPLGQPSFVSYRFGNWHDEFIMKAFRLNRATILAPIIGYKTQLADFPAFKPIYETILKEENFQTSVFHSIFVSEIEFEGTTRPIIQKPSGLTVSQAHMIGKPTLFDPNGLSVEFSLPKGTYATMLIRELIKNV